MLNNDKTVTYVVSLCIILGIVCTSTTLLAQVRVLHFPKDRSMGMLAVRDKDAHEKPYQGFEEFCEARGDVAVSRSKDVLLDLSRDAARDLSPLGKLMSDDLHSIEGWRIPIDDQDLQHLAGLTGLKRIYFYTVPISDKGLYHLRGLRSLECLVLMDMKITDAGMVFLSDMESLEFLNLRATSVTDKGLAHLSGLKLLKSIDLGYCKITDAGLEHLRGMNMLESLDLGHAAVTDAGLAHLRHLRHLSDLDLNNTSVTDAGLAHLSGALASLKKLNLRRVKITDAGLAHLANARELEELILSSSRITDSGLRHLRSLRSLKNLDISGTQITNDGLRHLGHLTSLELLKLPDGPDITEEGLAHLAGLEHLRHFQGIPGDISTRGLKILSNMALEAIHLRGEGITDHTMPYIAQLENLHELDLDQCSVTDDGLVELSKLDSLKTLSLSRNPQLTGAGLVHIGQLSSLEFLGFEEVHQTTDEDLAHLSGLKNLKSLHINSGRITDAGMAHLTQLSSLEALVLENAKLTDTALADLVQLTKLNQVHIAGNFTDEGLKHLEGLKLLRYLRLPGEGFSIEALEELKKKLPSLAYLRAEGASPRRRSLIGQQLTELDGIDIHFELEQARDKMILLCFFDMEQRPSRIYLMQLANQAEWLKEEGIRIVAVQTAKLEQAQLDKWIRENKIAFPVGTISGRNEQIRFEWGVQSLPWLILTDKKHVVTAEGFSINELDDQIQ